MSNNLLEKNSRDQETIRRFKGSFWLNSQRLVLTQKHIHSHVMVVGHGFEFPERCLLGNPPEYDIDFQRISSLVTTDAEYSLPSQFLPHRQQEFLSRQKLPLSKTRNGVFIAHDSLHELKKYNSFLPETFQCILFLRIVDLQEQLTQELLAWIYHILSHGGYFITSGGCSQRFSPKKFIVEQKMRLADFDDTGFPYSPENMAFVLQKP